MKKIVSVITTGVVSLTSLTGVYGAGIGVNTHIDHKYPVESNVKLAEQGKFQWVRDAISWIGTEPVKGKKAILEYIENKGEK